MILKLETTDFQKSSSGHILGKICYEALSVFILLSTFIANVRAKPYSNEKLLIISFDGFRWNYLHGRTHTPNFDRFIKEGVQAKYGLTDAFITKTFPNHMTLVTGLWEESHNIVANHMYDPELNASFSPKNVSAMEDPAWFNMGAEPIWVTNQLQKVNGRSGVIMWVGGAAPIKWVKPSRNIGYDHDFKNKTKIDTMIKWMKDEYPINLGLMYFDQPDYIAHEFGPESAQVTSMIGGLDEVVGYLFQRFEEEGLLECTNIIITSDHGFSSTPLDKIIDLDQWIDPSTFDFNVGTPIVSIWPKPGMKEELYRNLSIAAEENGNFQVYKKEDIPERFHYTHSRRIAPIQVVADNTFSFNVSYSRRVELGNHGYDNQLQDMHPFFLARGPAFRRDYSVDTFRSVDVYPLMCHLLNLQPAPNNGSMEIVSQLLVSTQSTNSKVTIATYIVAVILIAGMAVLFMMAACRSHQRMRANKQREFLGNETMSSAAVQSEILSSQDRTPLLSTRTDGH